MRGSERATSRTPSISGVMALTVKTARSSSRITSTRRARPAPMPCQVAPLPAMMRYAARRTASSTRARTASVTAQRGSSSKTASGTPPTRALDQASTSESPCSPST
jgi:hypothetical protein